MICYNHGECHTTFHATLPWLDIFSFSATLHLTLQPYATFNITMLRCKIVKGKNVFKNVWLNIFDLAIIFIVIEFAWTDCFILVTWCQFPWGTKWGGMTGLVCAVLDWSVQCEMLLKFSLCPWVGRSQDVPCEFVLGMFL